jgi:hypothetical protein
MCHFQTEALN